MHVRYLSILAAMVDEELGLPTRDFLESVRWGEVVEVSGNGSVYKSKVFNLKTIYQKHLSPKYFWITRVWSLILL